MPVLDPNLLARVSQEDRSRVLREDLEDALKEYAELDVLVELLQNALDAVDLRRFRAICTAAGRDPAASDTTLAWNAAVLRALEDDYSAYAACETMVEKALFYQRATNDNARRDVWWELLATHLGGEAGNLAAAASTIRGPVRITVRIGPPHWVEVEDGGVGIADIPEVFRHKTSAKRPRDGRPRRYGIRGSHGWGLTAILALSDRVEVTSRATPGQAIRAYAFSEYASFVRGQVATPTNEELDLNANRELSASLRENSAATGTHIRVRIAAAEQTNVLGHTLAHFSHPKFVNLLQLYTPIGQFNDYLLHPAYHCVRRGDVEIVATSYHGADPITSSMALDTFRLSGRPRPSHYDLNSYVNAGYPRNKSVHTIHRRKSGDTVFLSAADIQAADLIHELEYDLKTSDELPEHVDELDRAVTEIPRGFQLALSGGMRSEHLARPPRSTGAAFRGVILSETARPTLGRKHVVDQRQAIARAAADHETAYDQIRRAVLPTAEPPPASPAALRWKREFFQATRDALLAQPPLGDLLVWAGHESREARVMISFGELLARQSFGDFRVLRAHLKDIYDFAFLFQATVAPGTRPTPQLADTLRQGGYVEYRAATGCLRRYGIGEFKERGEDVLDDFRSDDPRKMPGTPDLLVCWSFDRSTVEDFPWTVQDVTDDNAEFPGQTHLWVPNRGEVARERPLAVVALKELIVSEVRAGRVPPPPSPWPAVLPDVYY